MLQIFSSLGQICVFGLTREGRGYTRWMRREGLTEEALAKEINRLEMLGCVDRYFALAGFRPGTENRRAADAIAFTGYGIDIDVHSCTGAEQEKQVEGEIAWLLAACAEAGVPPTLVVRTGRGAQAFWYWDQAVDDVRWRRLSDGMGTLLEALDVPYDRQVQGDRARLFRLPGTMNSKAGRVATVATQGKRWRLKTFEETVARALEERNLSPVPSVAPRPKNRARDYADVANCDSNRKRLTYILRHLPSDFHAKTDDAGESYRLWRNTIWAAQRTGLPNALEEVLAWARRAGDNYDDLDEAVMRVWNSEERPDGVTAATLVWLGTEYGSKKMAGMHFLDAEEAARVMRLSGEAYRQELVPDEVVAKPEFDIDSLDLEATGKTLDTDSLNFDIPSEQTIEDIDIDSLDLEATGKTLDLDALDLGVSASTKSPSKPSAAPLDFDPDLLDFDGGGPPPSRRFSSALRPSLCPREGSEPRGVGAPGLDMPPGLLWANGELCVIARSRIKGGSDEDTGPEADVIGYGAIEVVLRERRPDAKGEEKFETVFAIWNREGTRRVNRVTIPDSELAAGDKVLARMCGAGYPSNPSLARGGAIMSKVLRSLVNEHMRVSVNRKTYEQCGWQEDGSFLLGPWLHTAGGNVERVPIAASVQADCGSYGERRGSLEGEQRVLNALQGAGSFSVQQQAYICLYLGTILATRKGYALPTVYTYARQTGGAKSTTALIGEGMFGFAGSVARRGSILSWEDSSVIGLQRALSARGTMSVTADDFVITEQKYCPSTTALKRVIMGTGNVGAGRKCQVTGALRESMPGWGGNLFITSNAPIERILSDGGNSPEAAYARTLVHNWEFPPLDYSKSGGARKYLNGLKIEDVSREQHGFIGPMFIQWIVDNTDYALAHYDRMFADLVSSSEESGTAHLRRFMDPLIAAAEFAARWLISYGLVTSWKEEELVRYLHRLPAQTEYQASRLSMSSEEKILAAVLTDVDAHTVWENERGQVITEPTPILRQRGVHMRVTHDFAYISEETVARSVLAKGAEPRWFISWMLSQGATPVTIDFTAGMVMVRQRRMCWRLPRKLVVPEDMVTTNVVSDGAGPPASVVDLAQERRKRPMT